MVFKLLLREKCPNVSKTYSVYAHQDNNRPHSGNPSVSVKGDSSRASDITNPGVADLAAV